MEEISKTGTKVLCIALGEEAPPESIHGIEIIFVPYLRDAKKVARYHQATDIYVHPARTEVWGLTITEALCSTPVVASAVGGIPEQVVEGKTGFLVPVGDAQAMAGRILDLIVDDRLRLRMGRQAAEDAARQFGVDRMVGEYLAFYQEILK